MKLNLKMIRMNQMMNTNTYLLIHFIKVINQERMISLVGLGKGGVKQIAPLWPYQMSFVIHLLFKTCNKIK